MTTKQLDNYVERMAIFERDRFRCQHCSMPLQEWGYHAQLAHILPNTKGNNKKYGKAIVDHSLNKLSVCGLTCNAKVLIGNSPIKIEAHVNKIKEAIANGIK